jgi:hypothetical protein
MDDLSKDCGLNLSAHISILANAFQDLEQRIQTQDLRVAYCQEMIASFRIRNDQLTKANADLTSELARLRSTTSPPPPRPEASRISPGARTPSLAQISAVSDRIDTLNSRIHSPDDDAAILAAQQQIRKDLAEIKTACAALAAGDAATREALDSARDWNAQL